MTIAEGGGRRAVSHKLRDMYVPTLKANYMVWPLVQIVNFRLMPIQYQLVSIFRTFVPVHLLTDIAFRFDNRYRLDCISLLVQRR